MTHVVSRETGAAMIGCELAWRRDGADWVLLHKRRRMGRVVADSEHPGMWRSVKSGGRLSDMATCLGQRMRSSPQPPVNWNGRSRIVR